MKKLIYVYLISHNCTHIKTHTYIGASHNFKRRLSQHNGNLTGGPRITRKAAGYWEPVFVLEMPASRTFSSKMLKKEWKCSSRGLESRVRKGFELALKYNLQCYISARGKPSKISILKDLSSRWEDGRIRMKRSEIEDLIKTE
jgi:predicted GIY-YIG superfamily endonuclease